MSLETKAITGYCTNCKKYRYLLGGICSSCDRILGLANFDTTDAKIYQFGEHIKRPTPLDDKDKTVEYVFVETVKRPHHNAQPKEKQDDQTKRRVKADKIADERMLLELLPKLRSGDAWYEEACDILKWSKDRVMFTYRRLKTQGHKKPTTDEMLFSLLTTTPQTIGEIAGKTFLCYEWVYQCLARMAKTDKRVKVARTNANQLLYYV